MVWFTSNALFADLREQPPRRAPDFAGATVWRSRFFPTRGGKLCTAINARRNIRSLFRCFVQRSATLVVGQSPAKLLLGPVDAKVIWHATRGG